MRGRSTTMSILTWTIYIIKLSIIISLSSVSVFSFIFFFFSSRRRHTRYIGDWSSDVCSSDLYPSGGPSALGDPGQIGRALLALVLESENALLTVPGGGTLRVSTRREERDGGAWAVAVLEDDGPHIPDHLLARISEPFVVPDGQSGRGPSVGLSAAHAIVDTHGGRLTVANRPDRGVTYKVELPAG